MGNLCIFGDSITQGVMDIEVGGWATRLMVHFWREWEAHNVNVYTLGVSGETSEDLVQRFDVEAAARIPRSIIVATGTNDAGFFEDGSVQSTEEQFKQNLRILVKKARKYTNTIALVGVTPVYKTLMKPFGGDRCYSPERAQLFDMLVQNICAEEQVHYIPVADILGKEDFSDGLHPNAEGHRKMYERVREHIMEHVLTQPR